MFPADTAKNGDPVSSPLKDTVQDRHGETGMVYVSVAGDKNHIHRIPTTRKHFLARRGRMGSRMLLQPHGEAEFFRYLGHIRHPTGPAPWGATEQASNINSL